MPTRAEFKRFCANVHMVDTSAYTRTEQATMNKADSMLKLGDLETILSDLFCLHRHPDGNVTIDEFGVPLRGMHEARQHNKSKPNAYHLKGFGLNETMTGYLLRLYMYRGRDEKRPKDITATSWPCHKLIGDCLDLHDRGCLLWADNWFSSILTINCVHKFGVGYVVMITARPNRLSKAFTKPPKN